jgi:hypothetical protein
LNQEWIFNARRVRSPGAWAPALIPAMETPTGKTKTTTVALPAIPIIPDPVRPQPAAAYRSGRRFSCPVALRTLTSAPPMTALSWPRTSISLRSMDLRTIFTKPIKAQVNQRTIFYLAAPQRRQALTECNTTTTLPQAIPTGRSNTPPDATTRAAKRSLLSIQQARSPQTWPHALTIRHSLTCLNPPT